MAETNSAPEKANARTGKFRKTVRIVLISLLSLLLLFTITMAVVVNIVLTPSKITPLIEKIANEQLEAEVRVGKVELTFFSTYPRVELEVKDGLIVSRAMKDSLFDKTDTLLGFSRCRINVNMGAYLKKKRLALREITLDSARVYVFTRADGKSNYDIFGNTPSDSLQETDTAACEPLLKGISCRSLNINHAFVYFDDRANNIYGRVENANLQARIRLSKVKSKLHLELTNDNLLFWQDQKLLVNKVALNIKTGLEYNADSGICHLKGTKIKLNDIGFGAKGDFIIDSVTRDITMDVGFGLRTPSLKDVLGMIPESVMQKTPLDAEGQVDFGCRLSGVYGHGKLPEAKLKIKIKNGTAHYAGMPYGIDTLVADLDAFVDLNKQSNSYADLKILRLKAMDVDILASCRVDSLLTDPVAEFSTSSNLNMSTLKKIFPFQPGVDMGGEIDADLKGRVRLSDIKQKNYGRIVANGHIDMRQVFLNDTNKDFNAHTDAYFRFKSKRFLGAELTINKIHWKGPHIKAYMDTLRVRAYSVPPKDTNTTQIIRLGGSVYFSKVYARMFDTLLFYNTRTKAKVSLKPSPENPRKPLVNFDFETDTVYGRSGKTEAKLRKAEVHLELTRFKDTLWWPKATVDMRKAVVSMPEFALPLRFNRLKGSLDGGNVDLKRASVRVGNSNLTVKGKFYKLWRVYKGKEMLRAEVTIKSKMLDCNQLINVLASPVDSTAPRLDEVSAQEEALQDQMDEVENTSVHDTLQQAVSLFLVPRKMDVKVNLDAKKVVYDKLIFENILGNVEIRNSAVNLKNLYLQTLGAEVYLSMVYATPTRHKGDAGFDMNIRGIKIDSLIKTVPALDSTLPMLRSFEGVVDLQTVASTEVDSNMNILLPSLTAALRLHGENLVLMDGETFAEISKILMFKNKKRNMIDSISAVITVQDGQVTVYPFEIEIDRYRVGVGGHQDLDMNFNYHISVLKSPVPFKLGINVKGNLEKLKFGVGKALYKNAFTPAEIRKVDSARLDLGRQIVRQFEGWMNRERRVIRKVDFPTVPIASETDTIPVQDTAAAGR